jgi:hypothetical protein
MSGRVRSVPARCGAVRSVAVRCIPFWQEAAPVVGWRWWRWCWRRWWLACVASCPGAEDGVGDAARARVPAVPAGASPEMERSRSAAVWGSSVAWHVGGPALRLPGAVAVGNLGGVALQRRRISFFPASRSLPVAVGCPVAPATSLAPEAVSEEACEWGPRWSDAAATRQPRWSALDPGACVTEGHAARHASSRPGARRPSSADPLLGEATDSPAVVGFAPAANPRTGSARVP